MNMTDALAFIDQMRGPPLWVLWAVVAATALFVALYLPRALWIGWQLGRCARRVAELRARGAATAPEDVARILSARPLRRAWAEYEGTLHRIERSGAAGENRSTVAAGTVFTREGLVDRRLFDEFVRHLPGVLTGLGIIGTFAGLLSGLQGFNPSEDPSLARLGLKALLGGVEHAFYASAVAIGCAIMITLIEKLLVVRCYHAADALAMAIDALYAGGAGEDYLARLVRASEASARSSAELRDALAGQFRDALSAFAQQQAVAQARQADALGAQIAQTVAQALAAPMRELAAALKSRPDPSAAVLAEVSDVLNCMASDRAAAADAERQRQAMFDASMGRSYAGLSAEVGRMIAKVAESVQCTQAQIAQIQRVAVQATDGIGDGVRAMNEAARQFAAAGEAAGATVGQAADAGRRLEETARMLQSSCASIGQAFDRYVDARVGIDAQIESLGGLIDGARREAGVNAQMVAGMQETVDGLRRAQQSSVHHLEQVNDRLVTAFDAFGSSMKGQVASVMKQTDQHTSTAMQHLLGVVQELGLTLSRARGG